MNVSEIVVLKPPFREVCCPRAGRGTVFVAVMQGEVTLVTGGVGAVRLPACSLLYGPAALVAGQSASDDAVGITWAVDVDGVASMMELMPMDELTAIVLQDSAFEAPGHAETLVAALGYLSCRLLAADAAACPPEPPTLDGGDERVRQARQFMEASLDVPLTLAELSARLACSPATLTRAFKASGLPSPIRYFADLRVNHAKVSLQQSELSISNIAASLGFRELATFSHFFRKYTGQSPRDYRRNCRWLL